MTLLKTSVIVQMSWTKVICQWASDVSAEYNSFKSLQSADDLSVKFGNLVSKFAKCL